VTVSDEKCRTRRVLPNEVEIVALGEWTSPETGCTYPQGWEITLDHERFVVSPIMSEQEVANQVTFTCWEGVNTVGGDATGRAYVELQGYCNSWSAH
jgi:predicted secreted hydrolase